MSLRLHQWIRDLYLLAARSGTSELPALLLERVSQLVPHASSQWQVVDAHGRMIAHCGHDSRSPPGGTDRGSEAPGDSATFAVGGHDSQHSHRFSFGRHRSASAFDVEERALLERIVEHLAGAEALSRQLASRVAANADEPRSVGTATVDRRGQLTATDAEFTRLLREAQPAWDGRTLPFKLPETIDPARPGIVYKGLWVAIEPVANGHVLRVRPDRRAVKLSDREREIAERVAEGYTFREIGTAIGVAPSTVSTHLYNLYAKLGIRRRAELVTWLRQHRRES